MLEFVGKLDVPIVEDPANELFAMALAVIHRRKTNSARLDDVAVFLVGVGPAFVYPERHAESCPVDEFNSPVAKLPIACEYAVAQSNDAEPLIAAARRVADEISDTTSRIFRDRFVPQQIAKHSVAHTALVSIGLVDCVQCHQREAAVDVAINTIRRAQGARQ